jgi:tetratricopeptide (TPR) repeat protein
MIFDDQLRITNKIRTTDKNSLNAKNGKVKGRKRGIKASRLKLEKAMVEAGFATQAALAERVAEIENLDTAPRDLISKVFREIRVEPHTIERIALALGVDAYTLYLSSDEPKNSDALHFDETDRSGINEPDLKPTSKSLFGYWSIGFAAILAVTFFFFFGGDSVEPSRNNQDILSRLEANPEIHATSMAFLDFEHPSLSRYSVAIRQELNDRYRLATESLVSANDTADPWQLPDLLDVDFVIHSEVVRQGRHLGLLIYISGTDARHLLLSIETTDLAGDALSVERFLGKLNLALRQYVLSGKSDYQHAGNQKSALIAYLRALDQMDKSLIEINVLRALDYVQRAIRFAPGYVKARAALCDILVRQSIVTGDKSLLNEAENECLSARVNNPGSPELNFSLAQVRRKQGRTDEAVALYRQAAEQLPAYIDAKTGLAEAYLNKYQQTQDANFIELGFAQIEEANQFEPEFWRIEFAASRLHYYSGDIDKAIEHLELSKALEANTNTVANLGTFYFCKGNIGKAAENYYALRDLSEPSGLIDNYIGVLNYMQENFPASVTYFESSLEQMKVSNDGIYEAWMNLADAYAAVDDKAKAIDAYTQGIILAEQYRVNGENSYNIEGHIIYSNVNLAFLKDTVLPEKTKRRLLKRLTEVQPKITDASSKTRVMLALLMLGEKSQAQGIYNELSDGCPGYIAYPLVKRYFD